MAAICKRAYIEDGLPEVQISCVDRGAFIHESMLLQIKVALKMRISRRHRHRQALTHNSSLVKKPKDKAEVQGDIQN